MIEKEGIQNIVAYFLIIGLFILAVLIVKPIITSIILGVLLAYIFYPIYRWLASKTNNKNFSAFLVCIGLVILIIIIIGIIVSSLFRQVVELSFYLRGIDLTEIIRENLPNFISSSQFSETIIDSLKSSVSGLLERFIDGLGKIIINAPVILLQLLVIMLIFFFSLKDGEEAIEYLKSLTPFKKEVQERFFKHFKDITQSVLVGQIVVGIVQGIVAGIGYFIFGVPNALILTILTILIGIIPIIGPWFVWIPIDLYLFSIGRTGAGIGLLIYGLFLINWIDTIIRPMIVSRKTQMNQAIVLIGMIGGLFVFGVLGLLIGPLILGYVLLVIELYRKKGLEENIIFRKEKKHKTSFLDQFQKTLKV